MHHASALRPLFCSLSCALVCALSRALSCGMGCLRLGLACSVAVAALAWPGSSAAQTQAQAAGSAGTEVELRAAQRSGVGLGLQDVSLPDALAANELPSPAADGLLTPSYRFVYQRPAAARRLALYLPGVFAHARIVLNGQVVSDTITTPLQPRPRSYERLRLVAVPDLMWRDGANVLEISLAARGQTVMPPVWIGPESALRERYVGKLLGVVVGPAVLAVIIGCMSLMLLMLWWRRPEDTQYGYFGGGTLVWALHTVWLLLPWPLLTGVHFQVWWTSMYMLVVALLAIFVLRFTGLDRPMLVRGLWAAALGGPLLLYAAHAGGVLDTALEIWRLGWVAAACCVAGLIGWRAWTERSTDGLIVLVTGATAAAFGLRDWFVGRDSSDAIPVVLTPYAGLLFVLLMSWILVDGFVRATDSLEAMNRELEERVASKSRELGAALDAMRAAKETAESANRSKTAFLATASHDLRQPIHALGLYLGALKADRPTERQRDLIERMGSSMSALDDMFNALLDMSRMDAGAVVPRPRAFALEPLLHRLAAEFGTVADHKGLRLAVYVSLRSREVNAFTDPLLLERIVRNLLANALKYTVEGGVLVGCRYRDGPPAHWLVEIVDTGPGIGVEDRERVFDEFYQVGNPARDRAAGLGLGLSIVRRLAQLLEIQLTLRSELDRGSRFLLSVPATTLPVVHEPDPVIVGSLDGICVAVIEDDTDVRQAMRTLLVSWGCQVLDGADADEVLAQAQAQANAEANTPADAPQAVHAIVADYRLREGRVGTDEVVRLRAVFGHDVPALVVSGDSAPERVAEIQASGLPWLPKPASAARLRSWLIQARKLALSPKPVSVT